MRIKSQFQNTLLIEKSEFICYLSRCTNEEEARLFIASIKKKHHDANHCCSAFVCGDHDEVQRCSDDGEPSGTAGVPMLTALKNIKIHDCCAVVVRYFGGIKLGAGGLIRAYSKSVTEALHAAPKVLYCPMKVYTLTFSYDWVNPLDHYLPSLATILDKSYDVEVTYTLQTEEEHFEEKFIELTQGKIIPFFEGVKIVEKDILE